MAYEYTTITIDLTGQGGTGTDGTLYAELFTTVTLANNDTVPPRRYTATVTSGAGSIVLPCTATAIKGTNAPFKVSFTPTSGAEVTLGRIVPTESATAVQLSDLLEVGATSAQPVTTYNVDATTLTVAPSIAQLQAMRGISDGLRVLVQDIGIYRYAAASAATADELEVVTPATGVGRWVREITARTTSYYVKDFGARVDGTTDDTAAAQAAANAVEAAGGGRLIFPTGICVVGDFTYADSVVLYGEPGAKFKIGSQLIDIPRGLATQGPLQYYVSTTGSATNHGLSATCPLNLISAAARRMPRIVNHDVVIYPAPGVYTEAGMIDEYGRKTGLFIDGITVNATRTPVGATYPPALSPWSVNTKGAKISIIGAGSDSTIIQGRADGVAYVDGTHPRNGIVADIPAFYLKGVTVKNYDICLSAHEGGSIAGNDVKVRGWGTAGILVESKGAKLEMSLLDMDSTGLSGYNIYALNALVSLSYCTFVIGNGAPAIQAEDCWVGIDNSTFASSDSTQREAVRVEPARVQVENCTFDKAQLAIRAGTLNVVGGSTIKNSTVGILCQGGRTAVDGAAHIFDNTVGIQVDGGELYMGSVDSLDGATQKYNSECGVKVNGGDFPYSPYQVGTLGNLIKGPSGYPEKNVTYALGTGSKYPVLFQAETAGNYGGTDLRDAVNTLLERAISPAPSDRPSALYAAWNAITTNSTNTVAAVAAKLTAMSSALQTAGLIADGNRYAVTGTSENALWHDRTRNRYNQLVKDLQSFGLMQPGGSLDPGELVAPVAAATYTASLLDRTVAVNYAGTVTVTLPASPFLGQRVTVKDVSGAAASYPITVQAASGNIDGAASHVIPTNHGWAEFVLSGGEWSVVGTDKRQLTATLTHNFGSIAAGAADGATIAVPGAAVGDPVIIGAPNILSGVVPWGYVYDAGVVAVILSNHTGSAFDPGSADYGIRVLKS